MEPAVDVRATMQLILDEIEPALPRSINIGRRRHEVTRNAGLCCHYASSARGHKNLPPPTGNIQKDVFTNP